MHFLLNKLLYLGAGKSFYTFSNADGKVWMMPVKNMRVAMNLYQPSGIKGKLLKQFFPCLHNIRLVRTVIKAERTTCELQEDLRNLLCRVFRTADLEFAVFCGTPCVHQKITIQLSNSRQILGYCKVVDNEEIAELFQREAEILQRLEKQGLKGIPHCLYCGKTNKGIYLFVQSTIKTQQSQVQHEWGDLHEAFIDELRRRSKQTVVFEESDYYHTLHELQNHLDWLPSITDRELIERVIDRIMEIHHGKQVKFSAYHADFTPWNMFVEKGKLFVFDWEYARLSYPNGLDRYHFFTQTAIFEKHWSASEIIDYMESEKASWIDREKYPLYLIDAIARFTIREKGKVTGDIEKSLSIWIGLLEYLQK